MWTFLSDFYYTNLFNGVVIIALLVYSSLNYKHLQNFKVFFWYCLLSFFQLVYVFYVDKIVHESLIKDYLNVSVNIFILIELVLFSFFLYNSISHNLVKRIIKYFVIGFFILFFFSSPIYLLKNGLPSYIYLFEYLGFLFFVIFFLYENLESNLTNFHKLKPSLWVGSGILILFSIITPVFLFINFFPSVDFENVYILNNISYFIFYCFLSYSLICKVKSVI